MRVFVLLILIGVISLHEPNRVKALELRFDCPFDAKGQPDYIRNGTVESCTCEIFDPGNPLGTVRWMDTEGRVLARSKQRVAIDLSYRQFLVCEDGWNYYSSGATCLKVFPSITSWSDARSQCQSNGGDLVVIPDQDFMQFLFDVAMKGFQQNMWIGLEDLDGDGQFEWIDNTTQLTYDLWGRGKPDNTGGNEHCAEIYRAGSYWNDRSCTQGRYSICQKPAQWADNQDTTFTCEGVSVIGGVKKRTYTARYATGPYEIKANVSDVEYDILKDDGPVYVQCEVDKYKTYPKPNVTLQGVQSDLLYPVSEEETSTSWVFHFHIHPSLGDNYTAKCVAENSGRSIEDNFDFTVLAPPQVKLTNCPFEEDGTTPTYVMGSSNAQCGCVMTGTGNPEGEAVWMAEESEVSTGNPLATFTISRSDENVIYTCKGRNENGDGNSVTYTPNLAYGPDALTIGPPEASNFHLTHETRSETISLHCEVNVGSFSPDITVHLEMTPGGRLDPVSPFVVISTSVRRYSFTYAPTSAGNVTAQCMAANSKFPELSATDSMTIHILELPEATLWADCPLDGNAPSYIAEGVNRTCTCSLTTVGHPPGYVRWVDSSGTEMTANGTSAVLTLAYDSNRQDNRFECVPSSSLGQGGVKTYTAIFAYGPGSLIFPAVAFPAVKLCPQESTSMFVECQLPKTRANPAPEFDIKGLPPGIKYTERDTTDETLYQKRFEFDLTVAGSHSITCSATNPVTGTVQRLTRERIAAFEPPPSPPRLTIDDGPVITDGINQTLQSEQTVVVKCLVDGGYPLVKRMSFSCGSYSNDSDGNELTLSLQVNKTLDDTNCSCSAVHDSGCYNKTSQFTLLVEEFYDGQASGSDSSDNMTGVSIGAGVGGSAVFILIVVLLAFYIRHRRNKAKKTPDLKKYDEHQLPYSGSEQRVWKTWRAFENEGFSQGTTAV